MKSANKSSKTRRPSAPRVTEVLTSLQALYPDAKAELYYKTPFQLLVSVVLSAQTTDIAVNKAMSQLYEQGLDVHELLSMGEANFLHHIKSIGLAPTKAKHIMKLCRLLIDNHNGQVPSTRAELEALPGVGRKTASVILGEIFGEPTIAVDTHVYRVTQRLGFHNEATPEKAEQKLLQIIPKQWLPAAHHYFILHGRRVCVARQPRCEVCPVNKVCPK